MILVDANLLVYAHVAGSVEHEAAHTWLDDALNGSTRVGLPWPSLLAFLRLVTNPRIFESPEPIAEAWRQVEAWLGCSTVWIPQPGERHAAILASLIERTAPQGNLIPDAHLAALAIEHGLTLCSADGGFAAFPDLRWTNPLRPARKA